MASRLPPTPVSRQGACLARNPRAWKWAGSWMSAGGIPARHSWLAKIGSSDAVPWWM